MLVEPPRPHLPARFGLSGSRVELLRGAAAVAAVVLALLSRGDAVVLAGLLVVAVWRPLAAVAIGPALLASSWRWGSTSLAAWAGAQAVLGPAGWVGPASAAAAAWLAAGALVLSTPADRSGLRATAVQAALAVAAADVAAGPSVAGDWWIRLAATFAAAACVAAAQWLRGGMRRGVGSVERQGHRDRVAMFVAGVAGVAAIALVGLEAPAWSGTVDGAALRVGAVVALAVGAVAVVGVRAVGAMSPHRP